ncbi:MAG TPA: ribosome maturation factor RimM [Gemmatimonadaceae bacterium]|nr:ribosome maturation factor RimM [Gemmatimonadaceae bacterium]
MSAPARPDGSEEFIIVGRVRKAHGIRGELVVEPITDAPEMIFAPGRRVLAGTARGDLAPGARELHVEKTSRFKEGLIVSFHEIADRTTAEQWRGRYFLLPRAEVSALDEGEVYVHELRGMRVELESGERIGEVVDMYELPQGLAIDVRRAGRSDTVLLLYEQSVLSVDRDAKVVTVAIPEGLLDK